MSAASTPSEVNVSLAEGVDILWQDGHRSHLNVRSLRQACPCATCNDLHGTGESLLKQPSAPSTALPMFKPTGATLLAVEPVGRYALQFTFSDGHKTGIYTWEHLRRLCRCAECAAPKPKRD